MDCTRTEQLKAWLRQVHNSSFSHTFGKNTINMRYDWNQIAGAIDRIEVYICGINPFTGEPLNRKENQVTFGAANQSIDWKRNLYGKYTLRFDAVTTQGERLEDFCEPLRFEMKNTSVAPYIHYSFRKEKQGWYKVQVESNCYQRLKGTLWLRFPGSIQKMPDPTGHYMCCYIARDPAGAELAVANPDPDNPLPTPTRVD